MPEVAPAPSANLVLCRWATVSGDEVFIHGAGVMMPPPQGIQWWLGGVIDINVGDARTGGRVELVDYPDYEMNATGRALLVKEVAKSFRRQMMSTRSPEFDAAVEWCAAKPYAA